jgi:3-deoxy-D-manno-octulosonic-acid transferase
MPFYRILFGLSLGLYAPFAFLRQASGGKAVGDWRGRMGLTELPKSAGAVWAHGVSVGEVAAARAMLRAIAELAPEMPRVLSSSTAAGLELAGQAQEAGVSIPFPFDLRRPVERALSRVDPALVLLTETEIWPLFLERCSRRGVPVAVVNGRISDRSYRRYRAARRLLSKSLSRIRLFAMQSERDAERIRRLGAPAQAVCVTGNVKFDVEAAPDSGIATQLRRWAGSRKILLAGSTHPGEEEAVLQAWQGLTPRPLLVLAPRRPERFETVLALAAARGIRAVRRTAGGEAPDLVLLDTVGELASAYAAADVAFIGGTLASAGGHNPIEAWVHGVPTLLGRHAENFRDIIEGGLEAGAAVTVRDVAELSQHAARLLGDPEQRERRGQAARRLIEQNRGAAAETARRVLSLRKPA